MVIYFRKLNKATRKDHYPLPFVDQMLERLSKHTHFGFLDGYSGFSQIPISQPDQEKTTFTCPFVSDFGFRKPLRGLNSRVRAEISTYPACLLVILTA